MTSEALFDPRFASTIGSLSEAVTVQRTDGRTIYANRAALALLKMGSLEELLNSSAEAIGERFQLQHEDGRPCGADELPGNRALHGEDPKQLLVRSVVRETGEERWLLNRATVVRDQADRIEYVINLIEDVTTTKQSELRAAFLGRAGEILASSLDYLQTLENVAWLAVPEIADWCAVDLVNIDGQRRSVAVAHVDASKLELAEKLRAYEPEELDDSRGLGAVVRTGKTEFYPEIADELLLQAARDREHLDLLRQVGLRSVVIVPMATGQAILGALTLVNADSGRTFTPADVRLAEDLGRRAAVAVENSRLFTERTRIARTLQESLLPRVLPEVPNWQLSALFRPAGGRPEIGGDFYDFVPTDTGWLALVGDVTGKGVAAATLTALVRHSVRGIAHYDSEPSRILARLDEILQEQRDLQMCTLVCVRLQDGVITTASAGHPLPLLVDDGKVSVVGEPGTILGAFPDGQWPQSEIPIADGSSIILYTDGVTEGQMTGGERLGLSRFVELVRDAGGADPPEVVALLDAALRRVHARTSTDDIAIVVARSTSAQTTNTNAAARAAATTDDGALVT